MSSILESHQLSRFITIHTWLQESVQQVDGHILVSVVEPSKLWSDYGRTICLITNERIIIDALAHMHAWKNALDFYNVSILNSYPDQTMCNSTTSCWWFYFQEMYGSTSHTFHNRNSDVVIYSPCVEKMILSTQTLVFINVKKIDWVND